MGAMGMRRTTPYVMSEADYSVVRRAIRLRRHDLHAQTKPVHHAEMTLALAMLRSIPIATRAHLIVDALELLVPREVAA